MFDRITLASDKGTQSGNAVNTGVERYRSGHNEAVLKTVCPQGRVGSNPTLSVDDFPIVDEHTGNCIKLHSVFWRSTQEAEGAPLERE